MSEEKKELIYNISKSASTLLDLETTFPTKGLDNSDSEIRWHGSQLRKATLDVRNILKDEGLFANTTPTHAYLEALYEFCRLENDISDAPEWREKRDTAAADILGHMLTNEIVLKAEQEGEWPPPNTQDELKDFVLRYIGGNIFTDRHIPKGQDSLMGSVFMPLALGGFADRSNKELENVGVIWEDMSKAGPSSINGMPIFLSLHAMNTSDWRRCAIAIKKQMEVQKSIKV